MDSLEGFLAAGLSPLGHVAPDDRAITRLSSLCCLLERWGAGTNLTGHHDARQIAHRLVLDAAALLDALLQIVDEPATVVDLGSGAGFPGIPIAVLAPSCQVTLVEARERRHYFQREARRALNLENLKPVLGRIEVLESAPADVAIAQALARPDQVLEWAKRWVVHDGVVLIPGGATPPDPGPDRAIFQSGSVTYRVPHGGPRRSLWWGRVEGRQVPG